MDEAVQPFSYNNLTQTSPKLQCIAVGLEADHFLLFRLCRRQTGEPDCQPTEQSQHRTDQLALLFALLPALALYLPAIAGTSTTSCTSSVLDGTVT